MAQFNIYEKITNDFISALENGTCPWRKPWFGKKWAISHTNGRVYSFLNQMLLGKGGEWLSFKQIQAEGGKIKAGCKAHYVVFWKFLTVCDKDSNGKDIEGTERTFPILKFYNVWHISECEGITEKYPTPDALDNSPIENAEKIYLDYYKREMGDDEKRGLRFYISDWNTESCYSPKLDRIMMPDISLFECSELYYSTLFHEMTHSTGAENRLNREGIVNFDCFGSEQYSKEELIAEMGAAFLCNYAGLDPEKTFKNSAAYLQSWLKVLKGDKKMVVFAASKAEQAFEFILTGKRPNKGEEKQESEEIVANA